MAAVGKRDLAVVARVLVDLANDDPDVLVAERRDTGGVLVAVGNQLEQASGDARLDDPDPHPVARRNQPVALGRQLDRVAGVHLGELAGVRQVGQEGEARLARFLDEDRNGRLAALLGRNGLVAGIDEEDAQAVDVPLGDPVRRVERERRLVVLASRAQLTLLPERLGQAVFGLRIRAELEQPLVRLRRVGPLGSRRLGNCLVRQLALQARLVDGARWLGIDFGEGHEEVVLSGDDPDPTERAARRTSRWGHSFLASRRRFVKHST